MSFSVHDVTEPFPESGEKSAIEAQSSLADEIIDELVPHDLDWRSIVVGHPKISVALIAAAGFWLGRTRGAAIISGVTGMASETINEAINEFFGRDVV